MKEKLLYIPKYLSIVFFVLICFIVSTFQASAACGNSCKIQDSPAPVLEEYLSNVSKVIQNISREIGRSEPLETTTKTAQNSILASMSSVVNFSGFFSSFDFYVAIPITQEVPYPVKRDHQRLNTENERIKKLLKRITRSGYGSVKIEDACNGVEESSCSLSGDARSILTQLLKNNKYITDFYRLSIADSGARGNQSFILVPERFVEEMQDHYNKTTLYDCSQCEGGFADRIKKSISSISSLSNGGSQGIAEWKNTWNLLMGISKKGQPTPVQEEDRLLRGYLGTQGIPGDAADSVSSNLQKYNSGGLSTSNAFFNSANYTFTNIKETVNSFDEAAIQNFLDTDRDVIPIVIIDKTIKKVETTQSIQESITAVYERELEFLPTIDTPTSSLIGKILRMHYSLTKSINTLDKTIKTSQKVCHSQGQGEGNCDNYN